MARLHVALLGPLRVTLDGQPVDSFGYDKVRALLAYLVVETQRAHHRAALAALLWPGEIEAVARKNLRTALATLRQTIGDTTATLPSLLVTRDSVQFNPASDYELDVTTFTALVTEVERQGHPSDPLCSACAARLAQAVELYRGEFVQQLDVGHSMAWEEWVTLTRERLHGQLLDALGQLMAYHEEHAEDEQARHYAWRMLALEPWNETAHRCLMRVLARGGQRSAALVQYQRCRQVLAEELGIEPSAETTVLYEQIHAGPLERSLVERPAISASTPTAADAGVTNLPTPATRLIGREPAVAQLRARMLEEQVRLLTLVGPPGIGKTRLGLAVAEALRDDFADGVVFVRLAPILDPNLVASTIAHMCMVTETAEKSPVDVLKAYLRDKQLLLVLDNFEQVAAAAPVIAELLAAAPRLKVLVTSRAVLHLSGEYQYPVPPLTLPAAAHDANLEALAKSDAVVLFVERAQAARPDFALTTENVTAVVEICRRLDGLPLAIELAAARIKLFPPQALVTRLAAPLQLLTGGPRDLPAHQQTLRDTIEWSYELLDAAEQRLFRRLGVFVGGCSLAAVEATHSDVEVASRISPRELFDLLAALIDQSLVQQAIGTDDQPRFSMLEMIRAYALEQLTARGEAEALRRQHALYFLALAERAEPALKGAEQAIWLQRLEADHDNLRAALQWLIDRGTQEQALRLAGALWRFWRLRGYLSEGRRWLDAALTREQTASLLDSEPALAAARARALTGAGILAHYQGDYTRATALCGESLTLFRQLGDRSGIAAALNGLALVARSGGNYAAARVMYQESLAISRDLGDIWGSASSLLYLGVVYMFDAHYAEARPVLEESLPLFKQAGDPDGHAVALHVLGIVSWGEGDNRSAWSLTAEALTAFRNLGNRRMVASGLSELGRVAASSGDVTTARDLYEESLGLYIELGDRFFIVQALEALADVAVRLKNPDWAARLLGAAHTLREALGVPRAPMDAPGYARCVAAARAQLSAQAFASAWAAGQMLTPQEAVASEESPLPKQHRTPAIASPANPDALTARELEVLRLVAQGFTDAQVAERLIVSQRTVHAHLRAIYSKLNVTSRTAAARYAVDRQLL